MASFLGVEQHLGAIEVALVQEGDDVPLVSLRPRLDHLGEVLSAGASLFHAFFVGGDVADHHRWWWSREVQRKHLDAAKVEDFLLVFAFEDAFSQKGFVGAKGGEAIEVELYSSAVRAALVFVVVWVAGGAAPRAAVMVPTE